MTSDIQFVGMFEKSSMIKYRIEEFIMTDRGVLRIKVANYNGVKKHWFELTQEQAERIGVLNLEKLKPILNKLDL